LEDLRWVLVKTATALFLGMLVCLLGTNYVVAILKWPLERAGLVRTAWVGAETPAKKVGVALGNQVLYTFKVATNKVGGFDLGTNLVAVLEFVPMQVSTQTVLALQLTRNPVVEKELNKGPSLYWLGPAAPFISSLHIAFFGGIVLVAPLLFYFIGQYVLPALKWKEKKYLLRAFAIGTALFMIGVSFCYFLIAPLALRAAEQYSLWMGMEVPRWEAGLYFSFIVKFMLGMGLGFEMPVVILALVKIGILDYKKLAGFRRYMIVVNLILGALLTTPEVLTQVLMFIPLQLLYELSIWIAWYWERQDKKRAAAAEAAGKTE
jgi:sec-independent protein translocase protein TatC